MAQTKEERAAYRAKWSRDWRAANPDKVKTASMTSMAWALKNPEKAKESKRKWDAKNRENARLVEKRKAEELNPKYVAGALRMPVGDLTPELLELKREQLTLHRLGRQIKQQLKDIK